MHQLRVVEGEEWLHLDGGGRPGDGLLEVLVLDVQSEKKDLLVPEFFNCCQHFRNFIFVLLSRRQRIFLRWRQTNFRLAGSHKKIRAAKSCFISDYCWLLPTSEFLKFSTKTPCGFKSLCRQKFFTLKSLLKCTSVLLCLDKWALCHLRDVYNVNLLSL